MFKSNGMKSFGAVLMAATALTAGGCSTSSSRTALVPTMPEGDPIALQIHNVRGLAAADSLGSVLFVEEGFRFASAQSVYQMASAEMGGNLARVDSTLFPAVSDRPVQVIVSAEELRRERDIAAAKNGQPTATVTEVETSKSPEADENQR